MAQEIRVFAPERRLRHYALDFNPERKFHSRRICGFCERQKFLRVYVCVYAPIARVLHPVAESALFLRDMRAAEPTRVDAVHRKRQLVNPREVGDVYELFGRNVAAYARIYRGANGLAVGVFGRLVFEHEFAPNVLGAVDAHILAAHYEHRRQTYRLFGIQRKIAVGNADFKREIPPVYFEERAPVPAPADGEQRAV